MSTTEKAAGAVIERRTIHPTRPFPYVGQKKITVPQADVVHRVAGGTPRVGEDVTPDAGRTVPSEIPVSFWLVNRGPFRLFLPLEDVIRDNAGHGWNLHLDAELMVRDPSRLLTEDFLVHVEEHRPLTPEGLGHWLQDRLPTAMKRRLEGESDVELRARHGRPIEAWQAELADLLVPWGLAAVLRSRPGWTSPSHEAAEKRRKAEEARLRAEASAAEAGRVAEEQRRNAAAQRAIEEKLLAAKQERDEARKARAEEEAAKQTQRLAAEASSLKARERAARLVAERDEAEHRLRLADYERLIRQKELEKAELEQDIQSVSLRQQQKAEAEERMQAAERALAGIHASIGEVAAEVAKLVAHAAAVGAGAEELGRAVRAIQVFVQQGDQRMTERFNQLDAQLQGLFVEMRDSLDGGIAERRAIIGRLDEFFTELGRLDSRIREQVEPVLVEVRGVAQNLEAQFGVIGELIRGAMARVTDQTNKTHGEILSQGAVLREILSILSKMQVEPTAVIEAVDGRSILQKYVKGPPQVARTTFRKENLVQRDVGAVTRDYGGRKKGKPGPQSTGVQMNCVCLGDPVDLELQSPVRGYLTLINIGTSGRHWLISPHRYAGEAVPLEAGRTYRIPGPELFPMHRLLADGYDSVGAEGDVGEEGFVAFITPMPLLAHDDQRLLCRNELFWEVPEALLVQVDKDFSALPVAGKAVGTLRYLVIPRGH